LKELEMNYDSALSVVSAARVGRAEVGWVSPAVSVCLAAERSRGRPLDVRFIGDARRYAEIVGLSEAVRGANPVHVQGFLHGRTYSPLEWLHSHEHVHRCNETIGRLLETQLGGDHHRGLRRSLNKIVGELHDNVASHSRGKGFSAAQVYLNRIEYAVADVGCGFLSNARRAAPWLQSDFDGIAWAFVRGNTSAPATPHAGLGFQRGLGEDETGVSEYAGDEHAGWGLDELRAMIDQTNGDLWVASGAAGLRYAGGAWVPYTLSVPWNGVFIELEVPRSGVAP
jgi:hypothetical protein